MDSIAEDYPLVAVVGPTASGKSALAMAIAERFDGEIVNYDSVQVYRGFDVGTGKVPPEERRNIPHHLLDIADPGEPFTAGDYRNVALNALDSVRARGKLPVLVGGTGLYLRALLLGLCDAPGRSSDLRARLAAWRERRNGSDRLCRLLRRRDPVAAARIHPRDTQKVIRALEVCLLSGRPISDIMRQGREGLRGFHALKIGLNPARSQLRRRIENRVTQMFAGGLVTEARVALGRSDAANIKALGALGYRQACALVRGEMNEEEAIRQTELLTRRYAKRQMTWFRQEPGVNWFAGFGDDVAVQAAVFDWLQKQG